MQKNKNIQAFTLVELIVVITILAVLATIGFLSFQGYGLSSRDAVRLSDMSNINKGLSVQVSKGERLPIPEDKVDITASGNILTYQGYAGTKTLGTIGVHGEGTDPLDKSFYTYATNTALNKFQVLGYFEKNISDSLQSATINTNERYIQSKGSKVGIILDNESFAPININQPQLEIIYSSDVHSLFLSSNIDDIYVGTGSHLSSIFPNSNCQRIFESGNSTGNGYYMINPSGKNEIQVYCNMEIDGGGWTLYNDWNYIEGETFSMDLDDSKYLNSSEVMQLYTRSGSVVLDINNDGDYEDPEDLVEFGDQKYGFIVKEFSSNRVGCSVIDSISDVVFHLIGKKSLGTCSWGNNSSDTSHVKIDHLGKIDQNIGEKDLVLGDFSYDECLYTSTFDWNNRHGISWDENHIQIVFQYASSNTAYLGSTQGVGGIVNCNGINWHSSHIDHHYNYNNFRYMDRNIRIGNEAPYSYPYIQYIYSNSTYVR